MAGAAWAQPQLLLQQMALQQRRLGALRHLARRPRLPSCLTDEDPYKDLVCALYLYLQPNSACWCLLLLRGEDNMRAAACRLTRIIVCGVRGGRDLLEEPWVGPY